MGDDYKDLFKTVIVKCGTNFCFFVKLLFAQESQCIITFVLMHLIIF